MRPPLPETGPCWYVARPFLATQNPPMMTEPVVAVPVKRWAVSPEGQGRTPSTATVKFPAPPSCEVTGLVVLRCTPTATPSRSTEKPQVAPPPSVAPDNEREREAGTAVMVPPPHEPFRPLLGVATTTPAGRLSENPTPVKVVEGLGLTMTKWRAVSPPSDSWLGTTALLILGGLTGAADAGIDVAPATTTLAMPRATVPTRAVKCRRTLPMRASPFRLHRFRVRRKPTAGVGSGTVRQRYARRQGMAPVPWKHRGSLVIDDTSMTTVPF